MPRAPRLPSYRLHKPSGQAVVTLSGRDCYLGPHGSEESRQKYERLLAEWLASGRHEPIERAGDLTVSEVLAAYLSWAETYYQQDGEATSQLDRVRRSLAVVRQLYGPTPAARFGPLALKACRQRMVEAGLARKHINSRAGCIKRAWKWAAGEELVPAASYHGLLAVEGLKAGRSQAHETEPVTPADEHAIEAVLPRLGRIVADLVRLQLLTGARPGEVLALTPGRLDRSADVWTYRPRAHKTRHKGHTRTILLGPQAQAILARYLFREQDAWMFSPREAMAEWRAAQREARQTPVQPSQADRSKRRPRKQPGMRYTTSSYARAIARACDAAGVEHWFPHQLRHNAATRLVAQYGWDVARTILGHRSLDATRIYAEDHLARAVEAVRQTG